MKGITLRKGNSLFVSVIGIPFPDFVGRDFKVLVILAVLPVAAPLEAMLEKEPAAQVLTVDPVGEIRVPVQVGLAVGRLDGAPAVHDLRIGVVQRVDVHRQAEAVLRHPGGVGDVSEVEGRGVVSAAARF